MVVHSLVVGQWGQTEQYQIDVLVRRKISNLNIDGLEDCIVEVDLVLVLEGNVIVNIEILDAVLYASSCFGGSRKGFDLELVVGTVLYLALERVFFKDGFSKLLQRLFWLDVVAIHNANHESCELALCSRSVIPLPRHALSRVVHDFDRRNRVFRNVHLGIAIDDCLTELENCFARDDRRPIRSFCKKMSSVHNVDVFDSDTGGFFHGKFAGPTLFRISMTYAFLVFVDIVLAVELAVYILHEMPALALALALA
mmetsp:Transcript_2037/g.4791  ORF Transcript_2037/g.4791 Transcript_2037/m.4791 type:complete len:254 (+) Transcript_2037:4143-4904(+)